jgi:predicted SAM-dependent methyltransferase
MIGLDLGCGRYRMPLPRCFGVDLKKEALPEVVGDCACLPVKSESVQYVYCSHVLEHFTKEGGEELLQEIWRVLVPLGTLFLTVPNLSWAMCNMERGPVALQVLYGGQHDALDVHKWGYTKKSVCDALQRAGFSVTYAREQYYQINLDARRLG